MPFHIEAKAFIEGAISIDPMSMQILFQHLPEDFEQRVKTALQALQEGNLTDIQAASFFFNYFFQRLEPMYDDAPKTKATIEAGLLNQELGLIVRPNLAEVTMQINSISDLSFSPGVKLKTPSMTFTELQIVEDVLLARITLPEAMMTNKIKVKKLPNILRWLAPIATIQSEEVLQRIRGEDLAILDKNLKVIGY
jgi:hypothetical protein